MKINIRKFPWGKVLNYVLFYLVWVLCFQGIVKGNPWVGIISCMMMIGLHLSLVKKRFFEFFIILSLSIFGFIIDSMYVAFGIVSYAVPNKIFSWAAPLWIVLLHSVFATSINHSLSYVGKKWYVAAVVGALVVPFCYFVADSVHIVKFLLPSYYSPFIIGCVWFFYFPFLFLYNSWLRCHICIK